MQEIDSFDCEYRDALPTWANAYLWPVLKKIVVQHSFSNHRAFDLGCGNGATANMLSDLGFDVTGVDLSETGITLGRQSFPQLKLHVGNVYDNLVDTYGQFPLVVSLEVIEHCFDPHRFAKTLYNLIAAGGIGVVVDALSWLFEKLGACRDGKVGQASNDALARRPREVLFHCNIANATFRGWL